MDPSAPAPNQPGPFPQGQPPTLADIQPTGLPRAEDQRFVPPIVEPGQPAAFGPPADLGQPMAAGLEQPGVLPTPIPAPVAAPTERPQAPPVPIGGTMPERPDAHHSLRHNKNGDKPGPGVKAPPGQKSSNSHSTQNSLQIAEIRDGIVIMNDGSFRAVLMVKSINFDLMSQQEQEAVEYSYQGFLNSLYFPIQIFLRSQKVDLQPYIEKLDKIRTEHDNMLLALMMEDYIGYIDALSQQTNIMDKKFYIVIPFFPVVNPQQAITQSKNFLSGVGGMFNKQEQHVVINEPDLENAKTELRNRVQAVLAGLQPCGVQGLPLDTQELIELYYDTYNPDTATRQQLKDFGNLTADVVIKGQGQAPQAHLKRELQ